MTLIPAWLLLKISTLLVYALLEQTLIQEKIIKNFHKTVQVQKNLQTDLHRLLENQQPAHSILTTIYEANYDNNNKIKIFILSDFNYSQQQLLFVVRFVNSEPTVIAKHFGMIL